MVSANTHSGQWQRRKPGHHPRGPPQIPWWCYLYSEKRRKEIRECNPKTDNKPRPSTSPTPTRTTTKAAPPPTQPAPPPPPPPPPPPQSSPTHSEQQPPPTNTPIQTASPSPPPDQNPPPGDDKPESEGGASLTVSTVTDGSTSPTGGSGSQPSDDASNGGNGGAPLSESRSPNSADPNGPARPSLSPTSTQVITTTQSDGQVQTSTIYFFPDAPSDPSGGFNPNSGVGGGSGSGGNADAVGASSSGSNRTGAIVGGVLGALACLCLCAIALLLIRRRNRRTRLPPSAEFMRRYGNSNVYRNQAASPQMEETPVYTPGPFEFPFRDKS